MELLTTKNAKIQKGRGRGFIVYGLHLAPNKAICSKHSPGCMHACLTTAGNGSYPQIQLARIRKTRLFHQDPIRFIDLLCEDVELACKQAKRKRLTPVFRLNLTSDIPWECYGLPQRFPELILYDYTKHHNRHPPENYHLTFSRSELSSNHNNAKLWLRKGGNVAVVFKGGPPKTYWNYPVHSGDDDDLRFLDPFGVIALSAKGKAKTDTTGFVVRV